MRNNTPNHFVVDVTLKAGTDAEDLVRALRTQGVFVTSSSNRTGVPDRGHHYFRRLGAGEILVAFPGAPLEGRERQPRQ